MNVSQAKTPAHAETLEDDLERYAADTFPKDPAFRAAVEDAQDLQKILDCLIGLRRALDLKQSDVAQRMGVRQPTISGFENETSDPRLSTLQRYARAVEARLRLIVDLPASCDWVSSSTQTYARTEPSFRPAREVTRGTGLVTAWNGTVGRPPEWVLAA